TRSEFLLIPLMGAFMILFYFRDLAGPAAFHGVTTFIYSFMLVLSGDVLTRSTRPESLWWVLTAPVDRARFSWGTLLLVRVFQLGLLGPWGALAGAGAFALLRFPTIYWARRRTAVAAEGLELGGSAE